MTEAQAVTVSAAVAVCRAVKRLCGLDLGIKWVNDLYYNGKNCLLYTSSFLKAGAFASAAGMLAAAPAAANAAAPNAAKAAEEENGLLGVFEMCIRDRCRTSAGPLLILRRISPTSRANVSAS